MILLALERALVTSKHEPINIVGELSIEHVMPQAWEKTWPLADESEDVRERRERLLHTFGNLTLVTPQFNTSVSNRDFKRKQKELKRIARLLLSRGLEDLDEWNEDAILSRGTDLFDLARRCWPHPFSPARIEDLSLDFTAESSWTQNGDDEEVLIEPAIDLQTAKSLLDQFVNVRERVHLGTAQRDKGTDDE